MFAGKLKNKTDRQGKAGRDANQNSAVVPIASSYVCGLLIVAR